MPESIRIAAFDVDPLATFWQDGLPCALYAAWLGHVNGYVRLPETHPDLLAAHHAELTVAPSMFLFPDDSLGVTYARGYDYVDVPVNGGWTYGPDSEGWIGFDTAHGRDHWAPQLRRQMVERYYPSHLPAIDLIFDVEQRLMPSQDWETFWSVEMVEHHCKLAAAELAERARVAMGIPGS